MGFDKVAYDNEYRREHYDRTTVMLPKGRRAILKQYAAERGESLNTVIIAALEQYTGIDLTND